LMGGTLIAPQCLVSLFCGDGSPGQGYSDDVYSYTGSHAFRRTLLSRDTTNTQSAHTDKWAEGRLAAESQLLSSNRHDTRDDSGRRRAAAALQDIVAQYAYLYLSHGGDHYATPSDYDQRRLSGRMLGQLGCVSVSRNLYAANVNLLDLSFTIVVVIVPLTFTLEAGLQVPQSH
jgi:hypothetical protein